jgi:hypothetical protein
MRTTNLSGTGGVWAARTSGIAQQLVVGIGKHLSDLLVEEQTDPQ